MSIQTASFSREYQFRKLQKPHPCAKTALQREREGEREKVGHEVKQQLAAEEWRRERGERVCPCLAPAGSSCLSESREGPGRPLSGSDHLQSCSLTSPLQSLSPSVRLSFRPEAWTLADRTLSPRPISRCAHPDWRHHGQES